MARAYIEYTEEEWMVNGDHSFDKYNRSSGFPSQVSVDARWDYPWERA